MTSCRNPDFPVSYLFETTPQPEDCPILEFTRHDVMEIGYCHSGSGVLIVNGRVEPFAAGDVCVVTDQQLHISRSAVGGSRWSYFWLDPGLLLTGFPDALETMNLGLLSGSQFPNILSPKRHREICLLVRGMVQELKKRRADHTVVVRGLACALMGMLHRLCRDLSAGEQPSRQSEIERIVPALHYMASHFAEPVDVEELARLCSLSSRTFRRVFAAAVGAPPVLYLSRLRVRMAAAMLSETGKSISQIAFEVGFESINTFNRHFKAAIGVTPRQRRRALRE